MKCFDTMTPRSSLSPLSNKPERHRLRFAGLILADDTPHSRLPLYRCKMLRAIYYISLPFI